MAKNEDRVRGTEDSVGIPTPAGDGDTADPGRDERGTVEQVPGSTADATASSKRPGGVTLDAYDQVKHTRSASLWSGLVAGAVVLLILLAFIVQNQQNTQINLLFWEANLPLGVSLLIAAILGALTVGLAGGLRIFQLRRAAKKLRD